MILARGGECLALPSGPRPSGGLWLELDTATKLIDVENRYRYTQSQQLGAMRKQVFLDRRGGHRYGG